MTENIVVSRVPTFPAPTKVIIVKPLHSKFIVPVICTFIAPKPSVHLLDISNLNISSETEVPCRIIKSESKTTSIE